MDGVVERVPSGCAHAPRLRLVAVAHRHPRRRGRSAALQSRWKRRHRDARLLQAGAGRARGARAHPLDRCHVRGNLGAGRGWFPDATARGSVAGSAGVKIATLGNASAIHTQRWVRHFRARGHEVALWSLEPGPADLEVRPLPAPSLPGFARYPLATPALRRELERFAPDLVDAHYVPNYGLLGALAGRRPLAVTPWGSDLLLLGRRGFAQRARARFVLERADLVLVDAENLASAARALGAPPERVACIPWGVPLDRFRPAPVREAGLLLTTRVMEPIYDLPTVIAGVAPVLERRAEAQLVLAG